VLRILLETLIAIDKVHLTYHRTPKLYSSGLRYKLADPWLDIPSLLMLGYGDCKSLVAWLCAERRLEGQVCNPVFRWVRTARQMRYHVLAETPYGFEDPSKVLGMDRE
jgi:hypothetical protein